MANKMPPPKIAKIATVDGELAEHLRLAEEHLIKAVRLFGRKVPPSRHPNYLDRLVKAQEMVTTLFREELVRIRGPIKVTVGRKK